MTICATLANGSFTNFAQIADCSLNTAFGLDYTAFALVAIAGFAFLAYYFRLDSRIALVFGFGIVYMFDLLAGGNQMLQFAMVLLGIGIALSITTGVLSNAKEYSG